jgi:hypothetical protein
MVSIMGYTAVDGNNYIYVNGLAVARTAVNNNFYPFLSAVVPDGSNYYYYSQGGFYSWHELR